MCGISTILNYKNVYPEKEILESFEKGKKRGPENSTFMYRNNSFIGFHRLAINGLDKISNQPIVNNNIVLICNGEIYNWKYLKSILKINYKTNSDCEIIIHLYKEFGIKQTLQMLDGVFAFVLYDFEKGEVYVARDKFGVRPLFTFYNKDKNGVFGFSSEMKSIIQISNNNISQMKPGTCEILKLTKDKLWYRYNSFNFTLLDSFINNTITENNVCKIIRESLVNAVKKRVENTDRPISCLLSGGLDSSLITSIVSKNIKDVKKLHTWSIGLEGSEDIRYAKKVSEYLGTTHHEIILSEKEFLESIKHVIYDIESYDTTTIRASVGNWLISKYIKENSDTKVVFNGDGSDELTGGYLYMHACKDELEFDKESRRLLKDIHYFDVLRSDRSIASHGLEARTPFLDRNFVQTYLSIPYSLRYHPKNNNCEKYLLRKSFENLGYLPKEVLWRTKEAFSDGVSNQTKSWFEIIQDYTYNYFDGKIKDKKQSEKKYYKNIFEIFYPNCDNIIPYFWMPKYVNAIDSSARTLNIYKKIKN